MLPAKNSLATPKLNCEVIRLNGPMLWPLARISRICFSRRLCMNITPSMNCTPCCRQAASISRTSADGADRLFHEDVFSRLRRPEHPRFAEPVGRGI